MRTKHDDPDQTTDSPNQGRLVSTWNSRPLSHASFQSESHRRFQHRRNCPIRPYISKLRLRIRYKVFTGSVCIHEVGTAMKFPAGIVVPSEKVKSFIVQRGIMTADSNIAKVDSSGERLHAYMPPSAQIALFL